VNEILNVITFDSISFLWVLGTLYQLGLLFDTFIGTQVNTKV